MNWKKFLQREHTNKEWKFADSQASQWCGCYVGECLTANPKIGRYHPAGSPIDDLLGELGSDFGHNIFNEDLAEARLTAIKIDTRIAELLTERTNAI